MKLEILVTLSSLIIAPLAHLSATRPDTPGLLLVVMPPWVDASSVAHAAKAQIVGPTRAPFGVQIVVETMSQIDALSNAGAWFILDAEKAKWICSA
ncbi:hypothetical protein BFP70_16465 [Thioclava sp. SK-1]|uniref:hypothetical protein n=1 Tax=Thioclava sp. SK-1 TaxID=1889770 RepID=UPI0008271463|nr:hypothetical protein [Thioclava sp. SK-1]OCX61046.1 hypothetical protein BFP70_16465 [Thioclava sp. SK-1]